MARFEIRERIRAGAIERQCNKCRGWWPLEKFPRARCAGGRAGRCRMCRREDRRIQRAQAREALQFRVADRSLCGLPRGHRRVFAAVLEAHPRGLSSEAIAERTGYERASVLGYLLALGRRGLIKCEGQHFNDDPRSAKGVYRALVRPKILARDRNGSHA